MDKIEQIGKYNIIKEIGAGGFGIVYEAKDTELGRAVALKIIFPQYTHDSEFVSRFNREAQIAAQLSHPHIVTLYEKGESEGRYYLAMQLVRGDSLQDYLRVKGALPWAEAHRLMVEISEAVAYAHEQQVIHRDIKPANVLLDETGRHGALLTDFGLAKMVGNTTQTLTALSGTPSYMAWELWNEEKATPAADVYALGCIFYELLTGKRLFSAETPAAAVTQHLRGAQLPERWPADCPAGLPALLAKGTAKEPADRYPTAVEWLDALRQVGLMPVQPTPIVIEPPRVEKTPPVTIPKVTSTKSARSTGFGETLMVETAENKTTGQ